MKRHNAEDHYNELARKRPAVPRSESAILWVRKFNNWVKMVLIRETCAHINESDLIVHDWACGRGGDLSKWGHEKLRRYLGVDIALDSLAEAERRHRSMRSTFRAEFDPADLTRPFSVNERSNHVDIVSMQFAIHYMARDLQPVFDEARRVLRTGGRFIGTVANGAVIAESSARMARGFGNKLFQIEYQSPPQQHGDPYVFTLKEAVDHVEEYLFLPDVLHQEGFRVVQFTPFSQFYYQNANKYSEWYQRWVGSETPQAGWDVANLYAVFVLERI